MLVGMVLRLARLLDTAELSFVVCWLGEMVKARRVWVTSPGRGTGPLIVVGQPEPSQ
jgi:hypothetical protein